MNRTELVQVLSATAFSVLAGLLIVPGSVWMPTMQAMTLLALAVIAFGAFSIFVVHEGEGDEREISHRAVAGRAAFLVGGAVLLVAIVLESLSHALDPWLVIALVGMVVGKEITYLWSSRHR